MSRPPLPSPPSQRSLRQPGGAATSSSAKPERLSDLIVAALRLAGGALPERALTPFIFLACRAGALDGEGLHFHLDSDFELCCNEIGEGWREAYSLKRFRREIRPVHGSPLGKDWMVLSEREGPVPQAELRSLAFADLGAKEMTRRARKLLAAEIAELS